MGRLAGFRYRVIVKKLKLFGFEFYRQAAGSHEIWYNPFARLNVHTFERSNVIMHKEKQEKCPIQ
jgi:predicted RNA binding protein YcfA (HicA-like mRNA interferase family)